MMSYGNEPWEQEPDEDCLEQLLDVEEEAYASKLWYEIQNQIDSFEHSKIDLTSASSPFFKHWNEK